MASGSPLGHPEPTLGSMPFILATHPVNSGTIARALNLKGFWKT